MCLGLYYLIWHIRCVRIADKPKPKLNQTQQYHQLHHTKLNKLLHTINTFFLLWCFPFSVHNKKNKYIYQSYNNHYYNNNPYIGNLFLPVLCVCLVVVCVCRKQGFVKTFTAGSCWKPGKYWERCRRRSGVGGCSLLRITAVSGALYFCENNGISAGLRWYRGIF